MAAQDAPKPPESPLQQHDSINQQKSPQSRRPELQFIHRPLVPIGDLPLNSLLSLRIMSYNMLAQSLVRRTLFPTSGTALKWATRSQVLTMELGYYLPHIMCLQEVDQDQFRSYWRKKLHELGYEYVFECGYGKRHGVLIAYRADMMVCEQRLKIYYDDESVGTLRAQTETGNIGLVVCLRFRDEIRDRYPDLKKGIVVATTHLFWHPMGTFERARQLNLLVSKTKQFAESMSGETKSHYLFVTGDFNTQPFDFPYLGATSQKPLSRQFEEPEMTLARSLADPDALRSMIDEPADKDFEPSPEHRQAIEQLKYSYDSLGYNAISLYSVGYGQVDPGNCGLDNSEGEPFFSNWAHTWRGLLDYIFVLSPTLHQKQNHIQDLLAEQEGVRLVGLLRLPRKEEMGPEPSGQPRTGQYPSDHLCIMAEVELC